MINVLLDELPEEWETADGYTVKVNTDFRIGVQIALLQDDPDWTEQEKTMKIMELMFDGIPDLTPDEFQECIQWFLGGWHHDNVVRKGDDTKLSDFDIDQWRIYAAFLAEYGIDLNNIEYLHYWAFMGLLSSLTDTAFTRVIEIRGRKVSKDMSKEDKKALKEAKATYKLGRKLTYEEKAMEDDLYDFLGGNLDEEERHRLAKFEKYGEEEATGQRDMTEQSE